jgi:hypothetical protein
MSGRTRTTRARLGRRRVVVTAVVLTLAAAACGSGGSSDEPSSGGGITAAADRPSSPAALSIISPKDGQVVRGSVVRLKVSLEHATLVPATTTHIVPDEGHLHVSLDDRLISMTQGLEQLIPDLRPGQHLIKVEFVASDHLPFDPRVIAAVAFDVKP